MSSYKNFQSKSKKHTKDRFDRNESAFETPVKNENKEEKNIIKKHIHKFVEFCSFIRFMPDIFYDMITPQEGKAIKLDLYQRVMMRLLARYIQNYFCLPRGAAKTMCEVMVMYHTAICFPHIQLAISASTKESSVKIWRSKHDELLKFYPAMAEEIKSANFTKDTGRVVFYNGAIIDNLANAHTSKGERRHRGSLEESALIDSDLFVDALAPVFIVPRTTMTGETDPAELNGAINRFSTTGYRNSDEFDKSKEMIKDMIDLKGSFVFGSEWFLPVHFKRLKKSTVDQARKDSVVRFRQNFLQDWIGASEGALLNISKLIKSRKISIPELECPRDKRGNFELNEYVLGVDVARSASDSNNKTAIVVGKIIRNTQGVIRQVQLVNIISPPNGLNFKEQSIIVKQVFKRYGGNLDMSISRVKAVVIDANTIGQGLVEKLLEDVTDPDTNEELGCWGTINTEDKPDVSDAPAIVYCLKAQGINADIITKFLDYVESGKLKLIKPFEDIKDDISEEFDDLKIEVACAQTQLLIDEVANLRLKKTQTTITVEQVIKKIDKDRYSATAYMLYYIALFLEREEFNSVEDFNFFMSAGF